MTDIFKCADAGSEYCPCELAGTFNCISCSLLQGKDTCDCGWNGVCILNEYYMNNKKIKEGRKTYSAQKAYCRDMGNNCFLLKLETQDELAKELNRPGSYVFIRSKDKQNYFDVPMSVLDVEDDKFIYIAYQNTGCKTKSLNNLDKFLIRGPYWNGIIGSVNFNRLINTNCLVISKGIGYSSIVLPIKAMKKNNNNVALFLDKGKLNETCIFDFIDKEDIEMYQGDIFENGEFIKKIIKERNIELIFSAGSDLVHKFIYELIREFNRDIKFVITNNNRLCCGEGVCGACINRAKRGYKVRMCKAQVNPKIFYV
ncbi:sulfide/dihydroorotate dehydrogenase-like FAD/NAD-binding protein [Sporanaerobacter acetigenes]|uniref:sulfide/dihydroorotate dehydrogenase-like FAD/NAD-binding protein n=1 Tax=Sporanaerobacter acetigenes TaxID=165813 RepID=UPI0010450C89|nr:sulfide/dihydroorotate dehydrogenase-like FAD/NAD-binding protein [Sporanaerobacter acetigenes]